jgi:hypothetical protein
MTKHMPTRRTNNGLNKGGTRGHTPNPPNGTKNSTKQMKETVHDPSFIDNKRKCFGVF